MARITKLEKSTGYSWDLEIISTFLKEVTILSVLIYTFWGIWYFFVGAFPMTSSWLIGIEVSRVYDLWLGLLIPVMYYTFHWIHDFVVWESFDWTSHERISWTCFGILSISFVLSVIAMFPYGILGAGVFIGGIVFMFIVFWGTKLIGGK